MNYPMNFRNIVTSVTTTTLGLILGSGIALTGASATAAGSTKIVKVSNGGAVTCPKNYVEYGPKEKFTEYEIDGSDLLISIKICDQGTPVLDPNLESETFQTPAGVTAIIKHSDFKLLVQWPNGSAFKVMLLADFNKDFIKDRSVRIPLTEIFKDLGRAGGSTTLDLSVHADRLTELSTGAKFLDAFHWTQIRVTK